MWELDPVLISFMGLKIHWYGVLFAVAITAGFQVMKRIYIKENLDVESLDNLLIYCVVGIIVGARLAHCIFTIRLITLPIRLRFWRFGKVDSPATVGV